MRVAKVFWSGRSQAVRLPKEYRFDVDNVRIRRRGKTIILEPIAEDWSWLERIAGHVDRDFAQAVEEQPSTQDRPAVESFFQ